MVLIISHRLTGLKFLKCRVSKTTMKSKGRSKSVGNKILRKNADTLMAISAISKTSIVSRRIKLKVYIILMTSLLSNMCIVFQ